MVVASQGKEAVEREATAPPLVSIYTWKPKQFGQIDDAAEPVLT